MDAHAFVAEHELQLQRVDGHLAVLGRRQRAQHAVRQLAQRVGRELVGGRELRRVQRKRADKLRDALAHVLLRRCEGYV